MSDENANSNTYLPKTRTNFDRSNPAYRSSHSDCCHPVTRKSHSAPPVDSASLIGVPCGQEHVPNVAFVLDLLEKATAHGTMTNAEAFTAFDKWLSERSKPPSDRIASTCSSGTFSDTVQDDSAFALYQEGGGWNPQLTTGSCVSGRTPQFSRSYSSSGAFTSFSDPAINYQERHPVEPRRQSSKTAIFKGLTRLFGACGRPIGSSPPADPYGIAAQPISMSALRRGSSFSRPLPQVPLIDGYQNTPLSTTIPMPTGSEAEPVYAEYDPLGSCAVDIPSESKPENDDTDSIYDEADEYELGESYDTLKSARSYHITDIPSASQLNLKRADSGLDSGISSHSDIA